MHSIEYEQITVHAASNFPNSFRNVLLGYAEYDAVISIPEVDILNGEMPNNKLKLIKAWFEIHQEDLLADWKLAVEGHQPHKIEPLR